MAGRAYRMKYRQRSYVCNDPRCGRRFYKSHVSASIKMPHCPHCGSSVTETKASVERRLGKQLQSDKISRHDYKPYICSGCRKRFRSHVGRKLHIEENHPELLPKLANLNDDTATVFDIIREILMAEDV